MTPRPLTAGAAASAWWARPLKGRRDKAILATKCGLWWADARGSFFADFDGKKMNRSLRPDTIQIEIEDSLRRLEVDCIDLYQTHWPSMPPDHTPIADTMAVLLKLKQQGKIRAIGVSNVSLDELKENMRCGGIVSDQFRYSMLHREAEKDILPYCAEHSIATLTYMSLEQGLLTGKIGMDRVFQPTEFRSNTYWNDWLIPANRKPGAGPARVVESAHGQIRLHAVATGHRLDRCPAWRHSRPGRRTQLAQVTENAKAGELTMEATDLARIRQDVLALGEPAKA